jgi:hypothetical protein
MNRHALLQGLTLIVGMALVGFGVSVLTEYSSAAQSAAVYTRAPQCDAPPATATSSCSTAVDALVTRVLSWRSKYGSSYRVDLNLPIGSQSVWLADGPPPTQGAVVGVKVWRGRATLLSTPSGLIETTNNPLWQETDILLRALLLLVVGTGMLLIFAWQWGAGPASENGPLPADTMGTSLGNDAPLMDPSRFVLRPVRRSDAPEGIAFASLGKASLVLRLVGLMIPILGAFLGNPPTQHQWMLLGVPVAGVLVAAFALALGWRELYLRHGTLFADGQDFGATNWLGIGRRFPRSQLQRIVVSYVQYQRAGVRGVVLFVSSPGSVLVRTPGRFWRSDQLQRLAKFLGVEAENLWAPGATTPPVAAILPAQLRAQFRGGEPYWRAHPSITAWVLTPIILVAVVLLILAVQGH